MATDAERDLFASGVLAAVGLDAARLPRSRITGFLAMAGSSYDHGLMVVGRAVNGWTKSILPNDLATALTVTRYAQVVQEGVGGDRACPMLWVTNSWGATDRYNTKRSAFWRTIRGVVAGLGIADVQRASWPSHLVWSNLYKVSPADGGNPSDRLCEAQRSGCIDLLGLELKTYKPSRILFLTGTEWADPFLSLMVGVPLVGPRLRHVRRFGTCTLNDGHVLQCVVATHPQGKPEADWIREVVEAYSGTGPGGS